ncbi:hypothetical protein VSR68_07965 [Paraburkholderia phymatum]|uniref:hypothetical protein n=1 Tax=Paraburkholderia phymatum TaxID=148447 RepID=UPI0031719B6E
MIVPYMLYWLNANIRRSKPRLSTPNATCVQIQLSRRRAQIAHAATSVIASSDWLVCVLM